MEDNQGLKRTIVYLSLLVQTKGACIDAYRKSPYFGRASRCRLFSLHKGLCPLNCTTLQQFYNASDIYRRASEYLDVISNKHSELMLEVLL